MESYRQTDQYIHQLSQTLAKFGRSYADKKPDDGHTNLAFDPVKSCLLTRWASTDIGEVLMGLNLQPLCYRFFDHNWKELKEIPLSGLTQGQAEEEAAAFLAQLGLNPSSFLQPLHYDIPKYEMEKATIKPINADSLTVWCQYRAMGNNACQWVMDHLQSWGEVRIWPHHFDTGIYVEATEKIGFGFGLAMSDNMVGSPYFYYTAYPLNNSQEPYEQLGDLSQGRYVLSEYWNGAVLPLQEATQERLYVFIQEVTDDYLG